MKNKVFITKSLLFISLMLLVIISVNAQTISDNNPDFTLTTNGTCICTDASIGESGTFFTGTANEVTYTKRSKAQLENLINANQTDPQIALTCTSGITDMDLLFFEKFQFNQDISSWDVSSVTLMNAMFRGASSFNQPLNDWDVSSVTIMIDMFRNASSFDQPLNDWDVSSVTNMRQMFREASLFNQPLNDWDVSSVTNMFGMFDSASSFDQDLSNWCVEQIASEPSFFSYNLPLQNSFKPNWGAPCALPCPTGQDFTFTTQVQIDDFGTTHATCTNISLGNVTISGSDINNLDGLANLANVGGFLTISSNSALIDLDGLANLTSVGGFLTISSNSSLIDLDGLANLTSVGGFLTISSNSSLIDLGGLANLTSLGGFLTISSNSSLIDLDGLVNLTSVGGFLTISSNSALIHLDGLSNLTSLGGFLQITGNLSLTDISGIQNIDPTTIASAGLFLTNNPNLAVCNLPNICTYLAGTGPRTISGNLAECVDEASVLAACDPCPSGNVLYVNTSASGANNGKTWADAYNSLQSALENPCPTVTEIWVAAGTYKPSVYPAGCSGCATDRDFTFLLKDGISLYGGFNGTETLLNERDFASNETILSGDFNGDDVVTGNGSNLSISNNDENAHHVILSVSDSSTTVLDGFTVSGGNADGSSIISVESNNIFRNDGGGIYSRDSISNITNTTFTRNSADEGGGMFNDESNPDITNTNFADNMATEGGGIYNFNTNSSSNINNNSFTGNSATEGGGIFNLNSSPGITDTSFSNNTATNGGGIYNDQTSSPNITNTTFTDNSASFDGGGMFNKSSSPSITNTSFTNNSANSSGGGMYNIDSSLSITNTTFTGNLGNEGGGMNNRNSDLSITNSIFIGNSATDDGGAINNSDSNPSITNTTFVDNSATNFGGVIYDVNSSPTLTNCILWGNSSGIYNFSGNPTISHSILEGSGGSGSWDTNIGTDGGNNLDQDPLLVDAANGDLNLQPGSPAIDAGDNTAYQNATGIDPANDIDLAGNPRLSGSTIDMGAYEFNSDFYLDDNGVTSICETADFGDTETLIINGVSKTYTKRTRAQLDALIDADQNDPQIALTCTSGITDMFELFFGKFQFNQDISSWDVSNVTNMRKMFRSAISFNQPLDVWDVSNVTDMSDMFWDGNFNQSLNDWDVSNVTDMKFMFAFSNFNQPLDNWDVSNVTNMRAMFKTIEEFNQPLSDWDVSNVTNMSEMFMGTDFFNQPLNDWDVTHVTNMSGMFNQAKSFNQPLNEWELFSVTNMSEMFRQAEIFNQPLNDWDVSNVTNMRAMFRNTEEFNQPLNDWDVSNVTDMSEMFMVAEGFNQPLNDWDVSNVSNMDKMFMDFMFNFANIFNQDLSNWCVEQIASEPDDFSSNSPLQNSFKPLWGESCVNLTWTGVIDNDWNNTANWRPNVLPSTTDNIAINTQNFQPVIDATTEAEIGQLIVLDGNSIDISGVLKANGNLRNNGTLNFKSNATSTGQFDEFTGTITGTGEVKVERFVPESNRAFRYIGSPVNTSESINANLQESVTNPDTATNLDPHPGYGTHITGGTVGHGFDQTPTNNPSMFEWDVSNQEWDAVSNTTPKSLQIGEAYALMIRGDRSTTLNSNTAVGPATTLRFRGDLHKGDYPVPPSNLASTVDEYSLIANPYQAIVNLKTLLESADAQGLDANTVYVYDPTLGTKGGYATIDLSLPVPTSTPFDTGILGSTNADENLQPNQAFFIKTTISNPSLIFKENYKNTSANFTDTFSEDLDLSEIHINLKRQPDAKLTDGVSLRFDDSHSNTVNDNDAYKFWNFDERVAILNANSYLAIEKRQTPQAQDEIPLHTSNYQVTDYLWQINIGNVNRDVFLYDAYLDTETPLQEDGITDVVFTVDENIPESIAENRFSLNFDNTTLGVDDNNFGIGFSLYPNPSQDGRFSIKTQGLNAEDVEVSIYDVLGQEVFRQDYQKTQNGIFTIDAGSLSKGVYMVKLEQSKQEFLAKIIIK